MVVNKVHTVCFSGYRPEKFSFSLVDKNDYHFIQLQTDIQNAIIKALEQGYSTFLCGMAKGLDLLCASILLNIQKQLPAYQNITLVAVLPYATHGFADHWATLHKTVKQCANQIVIISPKYIQSCYHLRNQYMVEHSSLLIYYWDGRAGGTAQTVSYAKKQVLSMQNICSL